MLRSAEAKEGASFGKAFFVEALRSSDEFPVAMRPGETPVPIPNTTVKTRAADGTMLETAWESRWLPESYGLIAQLVRAHA